MTSGFSAFAVPNTQDGAPRLCGIEIEFAGLSEKAVAARIQHLFGGTSEPTGPHEITVTGTEIGKLKVELDTALRKAGDGPLLDETLDLMRGLIPVEVVSEPLSPEGVARLDDLRADLREQGALGSRSGMLLGFGVHLNPAVVAPDDPHTLQTIRAYALLEPWLRAQERVDRMRRVLPFVNPWPTPLITALADARDVPLVDLMELCAPHIKSRNHGLDLLPLFKHAAPERFARLYPGRDSTSARPAFHFRLPDSRIDEPDWSLDQSWKLWSLVEALAADTQRLDAIARDWTGYMDSWLEGTPSWVSRVDGLMGPLIEKSNRSAA